MNPRADPAAAITDPIAGAVLGTERSRQCGSSRVLQSVREKTMRAAAGYKQRASTHHCSGASYCKRGSDVRMGS
jgi:hypothetical protein